jgi:hypothetical protein
LTTCFSWSDISPSWWIGSSPTSRCLIQSYAHGRLMEAPENWALLDCCHPAPFTDRAADPLPPCCWS